MNNDMGKDKRLSFRSSVQVAYYLEENKTSWNVDVQELESVVEKARTHCKPRAIVIINPGNPTGTWNVLKFIMESLVVMEIP